VIIIATIGTAEILIRPILMITPTKYAIKKCRMRLIDGKGDSNSPQQNKVRYDPKNSAKEMKNSREIDPCMVNAGSIDISLLNRVSARTEIDFSKNRYTPDTPMSPARTPISAVEPNTRYQTTNAIKIEVMYIALIRSDSYPSDVM